MKTKAKIKLGVVTVVGAALAGLALNKVLDSLVKENLSKEGITHPKRKLVNKQTQDKFASSKENVLGQLFFASTESITVSIPNREGRHINALIYKHKDENSKYAVVIHGYRSSPKSISYIARRYYENGYNVLVPYLRAHHGSDYEYSTMGWHERFDVIDWINYIDSTSIDAHIVLHGVSMGAATVMMVTGESLPDCVACAIEDCGYTSVYDAYSYKIPKMMKLPPFPAIDLFRLVIKSKVGFDIKEASALNQVKKSCTPTLFLHGDSDSVVPVSMAKKLYSKASCDKEILIFKNAEHAMSPILYPEKYWGKVWEFISHHSK